MVTQLAISNVIAVAVGTTAAFVNAISPTRSALTFHNPGPSAVYVFPEFVLVNGVSVPLTPSLSALGGGFLLPSGATLFMEGRAAKQRWQALAPVANPLTITED